MLAETWYDAEEAVAAGLADRVEGTADPDVKNKFDLSIFSHQGREDAPAPPVPTLERSDSVSAYQDRRHRMNARRFASPSSPR